MSEFVNELLKVFTPELLNLVATLAILILTPFLIFVLTRVVPAYRASEFAKTHGILATQFLQVVSETVMRLAFSNEDLEQFQEEADAKNRDVRLVAAIHWIDAWSKSVHFDIDEERIISAIEARLAELKDKGVIAYSDRVMQ